MNIFFLPSRTEISSGRTVPGARVGSADEARWGPSPKRTGQGVDLRVSSLVQDRVK